MNLDEFVKEYRLLKDKEGRYYSINEQGEKGEPYCTVQALSQILNLSIPTIISRTSRLTPALVKKYKNRVAKSFNFNDTWIVCCDLLDNTLLTVNEYGWAIKDGQRYASISIIAKKLGLSPRTVKRRVKNKVFLKGKIKNGLLVALYNFEEAKNTCADLIDKVLPIADKDGILRYNGEEFAAISRLAKFLNISATTLTRKVNETKQPSIRYKSWNGLPLIGYNLALIKKAFPELIEDLPMADENDMILFNGEYYATLKTLDKNLGISKRAINIRVKKAKLPTKQFKARNGNLVEGFSVKKAKSLCADLLKKIPLIDENGIAIIDNEQYASVPQLAKFLGIAPTAINARIKKAGIRPTKARRKTGRIADVYNVKKIKTACFDILDHDLLIADESGWATKNGRKYASIKTIAEELKLSPAAINSRIKDLSSVRGKRGILTDFFSFDEVKKSCADLLDDTLLIADKSNWAVKDGKKYGTIQIISEKLKLSYDSVVLRAENSLAYNGKSSTGKIVSLYSLEEVEASCADILAKKKKRKST